MSLLVRVKERTGSTLSDVELQAMIEAIALELDERFGAVGETTVTIGDLSDPDTRYQRNLRLVLPADESQAITITERCPGNTGLPSDETDLAADDFRVLHSGRTLQRLLGGTNPRQFWAPIVEVTYTPRGNAALREEATIKLIQLDLSYQGGMRSEKAGDYAITLSGDYAADREAILQGLENRRGMVMA